MPVYVFECRSCGERQEFKIKIAEFRTPLKYILCHCGGRLHNAPALTLEPNYGFKPFRTEHITGNIVEVTSRTHKKKLLKEYGLSEAG